MAARFEGTYTALVTPFRADGAIDWEAFEALVEAQIAGGVAGLVPCGTTGESPALTHEEHSEVVRRTVTVARGRCEVVAGAGSNSTREAIDLVRACEKTGADAVMVVVPYYNRPTQEGLYRHYLAVAEATKLPLVVYNVPGRTGVDLGAETLARIAGAAKNVVAIKEATGNVLRAQSVQQLLGDRMSVLSGDDALTLAMIAVGARGVISVTSNVLPAAVSRATKLALEGKFAEARRAHLALLPVHEAMFVEANPGPVKAAMAARMPFRISEAMRGPMAPVTDATRRAVLAALDAFDRAGQA